jgi:hypothetical protein
MTTTHKERPTMLLTKTLLLSLRIAIVFGVVLVGMAGLLSSQLAAQNAANLTTLGDDDVSAYRWEAMAKFYAMQPTIVDLTTLNDGEILTYRWQSIASNYAAQPALVDLTTLSDDDISAYRWEAMADFYAVQTALTVVNVPLSDDGP